MYYVSYGEVLLSTDHGYAHSLHYMLAMLVIEFWIKKAVPIPISFRSLFESCRIRRRDFLK